MASFTIGAGSTDSSEIMSLSSVFAWVRVAQSLVFLTQNMTADFLIVVFFFFFGWQCFLSSF